MNDLSLFQMHASGIISSSIGVRRFIAVSVTALTWIIHEKITHDFHCHSRVCGNPYNHYSFCFFWIPAPAFAGVTTFRRNDSGLKKFMNKAG
jgi:hypothetical protein